jgi:hypothetical protein
MAKDKERIGRVDDVECLRCRVSTKHTILATHVTRWSDDESDVSGGAHHDLMACNGCGSVTYRETSWFSEEPGNAITLLPSRGGRLPRQYENLPYGSPLEAVYRQTITAYNQQLSTLAGAGVRLLIEGICKDQGIAGGNVTDKHGVTTRKNNLEGKINGMAEQGRIGTKQAEILHEIRFLGNDAAHELDQPSRSVLTSALDIAEHILAQVYQHPENAKTLAERKRPASP